MNKERLKNLLTDLYTKYNPSHLTHVDDLAERHKDSPYAAIDMIFFKYNHKNLPNFDPNKATEQYKIDLLKAYENGERPFQNVDLAVDAEEALAPTTVETQVMQEQPVVPSQEEVRNTVREEVMSAQKELAKSVEYTVTVEGSTENVVLPSDRYLASMAINTRVILKSESGRILGFTVKDVTYDFFSFDEKALVMIHLQKE